MSRDDVYTLSVSTIYIVNVLVLFFFVFLTAIDFMNIDRNRRWFKIMEKPNFLKEEIKTDQF